MNQYLSNSDKTKKLTFKELNIAQLEILYFDKVRYAITMYKLINVLMNNKKLPMQR